MIFQHNKIRFFRRLFSVIVCSVFFLSTITLPQTAQAQTVFNLPVPGTMISPSSGFVPAIVRGLTVYPDNPLRFNFIVDTGNTQLEDEDFRAEAKKIVNYFLASLTVPEKELWVNLSPYEKDRIVPESFGQTEMGRDLLAQDYLLKQLTASLVYPEDEFGAQFWQRVYQRAQQEYGTTDIPINTFNKVWIVPDHAAVYEHQGSVFVVERHLKVMLEEDYVALQANKQTGQNGTLSSKSADAEIISGLSSEVVREILIPEIEREVNEGKNFANLRQVYNSMILATWYKKNLKDSLLGQVYIDQNKVKGVEIDDKEAKIKIYNQYLKAFKQGVYDYIREDYDPSSQQVVPRKYFSGGMLASLPMDKLVEYAGSPVDLPATVAAAASSPEGRDRAVLVDLYGATDGNIKKLNVASSAAKKKKKTKKRRSRNDKENTEKRNPEQIPAADKDVIKTSNKKIGKSGFRKLLLISSLLFLGGGLAVIKWVLDLRQISFYKEIAQEYVRDDSNRVKGFDPEIFIIDGVNPNIEVTRDLKRLTIQIPMDAQKSRLKLEVERLVEYMERHLNSSDAGRIVLVPMMHALAEDFSPIQKIMKKEFQAAKLEGWRPHITYEQGTHITSLEELEALVLELEPGLSVEELLFSDGQEFGTFYSKIVKQRKGNFAEFLRKATEEDIRIPPELFYRALVSWHIKHRSQMYSPSIEEAYEDAERLFLQAAWKIREVTRFRGPDPDLENQFFDSRFDLIRAGILREVRLATQLKATPINPFVREYVFFGRSHEARLIDQLEEYGLKSMSGTVRKGIQNAFYLVEEELLTSMAEQITAHPDGQSKDLRENSDSLKRFMEIVIEPTQRDRLLMYRFLFMSRFGGLFHPSNRNHFYKIMDAYVTTLSADNAQRIFQGLLSNDENIRREFYKGIRNVEGISSKDYRFLTKPILEHDRLGSSPLGSSDSRVGLLGQGDFQENIKEYKVASSAAKPQKKKKGRGKKKIPKKKKESSNSEHISTADTDDLKASSKKVDKSGLRKQLLALTFVLGGGFLFVWMGGIGWIKDQLESFQIQEYLEADLASENEKKLISQPEELSILKEIAQRYLGDDTTRVPNFAPDIQVQVGEKPAIQVTRDFEKLKIQISMSDFKQRDKIESEIKQLIEGLEVHLNSPDAGRIALVPTVHGKSEDFMLIENFMEKEFEISKEQGLQTHITYERAGYVFFEELQQLLPQFERGLTMEKLLSEEKFKSFFSWISARRENDVTTIYNSRDLETVREITEPGSFSQAEVIWHVRHRGQMIAPTLEQPHVDTERLFIQSEWQLRQAWRVRASLREMENQFFNSQVTFAKSGILRELRLAAQLKEQPINPGIKRYVIYGAAHVPRLTQLGVYGLTPISGTVSNEGYLVERLELELRNSISARIIANADGRPKNLKEGSESIRRFSNLSFQSIKEESVLITRIFFLRLLQGYFSSPEDLASFYRIMDSYSSNLTLEESRKILQGLLRNDLDVVKYFLEDLSNALSPEDSGFMIERLPKIDQANSPLVNLNSPNFLKFPASSSPNSVLASDDERGSGVHNPGGIDFNPSNLNLQIKRDGNGVPLPMYQQQLEQLNIEGFVPVIINISPISVPLLLGLNNQEKPLNSTPTSNPQSLTHSDLSPYNLKERFQSKLLLECV